MIWTWIVGKVSGVSLAVWGYVALAGGILIAILKVFSAGKQAQKVADQAKTLSDVETKNEVVNEVRNDGADAARADLLSNHARD